MLIRINLWLASLILAISCSPRQKKVILDEPVKVTITGRVLNNSSTDSIITLSINWLDGYEYLPQHEIRSAISPNGEFSFDLKTYTPLDGYLVYKNKLSDCHTL
ncbi:MAG TPA: hypothetical protein VG737_14555 [Cyclobacteriaceae bacterium]|nr:hypothetical protein [Cyclobacteriaceae bacterium]